MSMLDFAKLCRIHTSLLETDPEDVHEQLYRAYPKSRGYSGSELDAERFRATFVLGMAQTYTIDPNHLTRVAFLVPASAEKWALERLDEILRGIFDRCQRDSKVSVAQFIGKALDHLLMGSRALQIEEPARWVAFGFDRETPLPDWMKDALLTGV